VRRLVLPVSLALVNEMGIIVAESYGPLSLPAREIWDAVRAVRTCAGFE
jgi:hypothetical protein